MGSACLKPREGMMWPQGLPFNLTKYVTKVTHCIIRFTHFLSKPILCMISRRQPHSTLSNALLMSSFKAISPILPFLFWFKWCMVSKVTKTLSVIRRSIMKALWCSLTIFGRNLLSLFAMNFEASLEMTLLKLMGLYCVIFVGSSTALVTQSLDKD